MKVLVTGAAGFIGSKLMYVLRERGDVVVGIDNYNDYYDVRLKEARVAAFGLEVRKTTGRIKSEIVHQQRTKQLMPAQQTGAFQRRT